MSWARRVDVRSSLGAMSTSIRPRRPLSAGSSSAVVRQSPNSTVRPRLCALSFRSRARREEVSAW